MKKAISVTRCPGARAAVALAPVGAYRSAPLFTSGHLLGLAALVVAATTPLPYAFAAWAVAAGLAMDPRLGNEDRHDDFLSMLMLLRACVPEANRAAVRAALEGYALDLGAPAAPAVASSAPAAPAAASPTAPASSTSAP